MLYLILVVLAVIYIFPFLITISTSFKTLADSTASPLGLIPQNPTAAAYQRLFSGTADFPRWFLNSVIVTVFVTLGRVIFDSMAGYALARIPFRGRNVVFACLVAVMAVPNVVLLLPKFFVIKELGMYDTYFGMIIPLLVDATGIFIMRGFFESIPISIEEQARIDGAGPFRVFWSIVLPMARPAVMTLIILSFQGSWNELGHFVISTQSPSLYPLTRGVASLVNSIGGEKTDYPFQLAAAATMTIPVIIVFFIFQRRIINTQTGGVKE